MAQEVRVLSENEIANVSGGTPAHFVAGVVLGSVGMAFALGGVAGYQLYQQHKNNQNDESKDSNQQDAEPSDGDTGDTGGTDDNPE